MLKIRCIIERITYQNPENGYSVLNCRVKDYYDLVPVTKRNFLLRDRQASSQKK